MEQTSRTGSPTVPRALGRTTSAIAEGYIPPESKVHPRC